MALDEHEVIVLGFTPLLFLAVLVGFVTGSTIFFLTRLFAEKSISAGSRRQSIFHKHGVIRPLLPQEYMTELLEDIGFVAFVESAKEIPGGIVYPALRNVAERHPLLNARIVTDTSSNKEIRIFEEITENKSIDFEDIHNQKWEDVLQDLMVDKIDSLRGPLWRVRFVRISSPPQDTGDETSEEPQHYKYALILNFHHAICDGTCLPDFCSSLMKDLDTLLSGGDIEAFSPRQVVHVERLPLELRRPPKFGESLKLYLTLMKDKLLGYTNVYLEKFPPKEHETPPSTRMVDFHLPVEETEQLKLKCHANGITVHGALTAAAAVAMYRICTSKKAAKSLTMHTMHAINLRKQCRPPVPSTDLGSFFTGVMLDVSVGPKQDFWNLAKLVADDIHSGMQHHNQLKLQAAIVAMLSRMSYDKRVEMMTSEEVVNRKVSFAMSNMGVIEDTFETKNFEVTKFMGCSAEHRLVIGSVFAHITGTFRGQLNWTVNYRTNMTSQSEALNYRDKIQEVLLDAIQN